MNVCGRSSILTNEAISYVLVYILNINVFMCLISCPKNPQSIENLKACLLVNSCYLHPSSFTYPYTTRKDLERKQTLSATYLKIELIGKIGKSVFKCHYHNTMYKNLE